MTSEAAAGRGILCLMVARSFARRLVVQPSHVMLHERQRLVVSCGGTYGILASARARWVRL